MMKAKRSKITKSIGKNRKPKTVKEKNKIKIRGLAFEAMMFSMR